jgi:hypothetical protein
LRLAWTISKPLAYKKKERKKREKEIEMEPMA